MSVTSVQLSKSINRAVLFDHEQLSEHIFKIMGWQRYICPFRVFLDYRGNEMISVDRLLLLDSFFLIDKNVTTESCFESLFEMIKTQYSHISHIIWIGDRNFPNGMMDEHFFYPQESYTSKFKEKHDICCIVFVAEGDDGDFCFNLCYKELQATKLV